MDRFKQIETFVRVADAGSLAAAALEEGVSPVILGRRIDALEARGAMVVPLPGPGGKVDLAAMLKDLAQREVNEVHVEAGHKLNGSLVREGLVDEFLVYLAPKLLGAGRGMAAIGPLASLTEAVALDFRQIDPIGGDLRVLARVHGRDGF